MIRIAIAFGLAGTLLYSAVTQAQEVTPWLRVQVVPTPQHAEMWEKKIGSRICVVSVSVRKEIRAVLLRGVTKELSGIWHVMEWYAPTIDDAKDRRLQLQAMYGNMAVGMEVSGRDYFHNECTDLPPI